jgi:hypothetical protein
MFEINIWSFCKSCSWQIDQWVGTVRFTLPLFKIPSLRCNMEVMCCIQMCHIIERIINPWDLKFLRLWISELWSLGCDAVNFWWRLMEALGSSETLLRLYRITWHHIRKENLNRVVMLQRVYTWRIAELTL